MPLSPALLTEIDAEILALRKYKDRMGHVVDERITALESVRQPWDFAQVALPFTGTAAPDIVATNGNGSRVVVMQVKARAGSSANTGLRAAILDVMREMGSGRAPVVAQALAGKGFTNDRKTPLAIRVYNDMWRMAQTGVMTAKDGVFTLAR